MTLHSAIADSSLDVLTSRLSNVIVNSLLAPPTLSVLYCSPRNSTILFTKKRPVPVPEYYLIPLHHHL